MVRGERHQLVDGSPLTGAVRRHRRGGPCRRAYWSLPAPAPPLGRAARRGARYRPRRVTRRHCRRLRRCPRPAPSYTAAIRACALRPCPARRACKQRPVCLGRCGERGRSPGPRPPGSGRIVMDDGVGDGQIETGAAGLEADQKERHLAARKRATGLARSVVSRRIRARARPNSTTERRSASRRTRSRGSGYEAGKELFHQTVIKASHCGRPSRY